MMSLLLCSSESEWINYTINIGSKLPYILADKLVCEKADTQVEEI